MINELTINEEMINGAIVTDDEEPLFSSHEFLAYQLYIHDENGVLLAYLPAFKNTKWTRVLSEVCTLSIQYPNSEFGAEYLEYGNVIQLRDARGTLLESFRVMSSNTLRSGLTEMKIAQCESWLSELNDEWLTTYSVIGQTVGTIVDDLLYNYTVNGSTVRPGFIDSAIKSTVVNFNATGISIRDALKKLHAMVGGDYYVHPRTKRLYWRTQVGKDYGQQIRYGTNLTGIERSVDPRNLVTQLWLYGEGGTFGTRISLTDAGNPTDYVEDYSYTTRKIKRVQVERDITSAEQLLAVAQATIEELSIPETTYRISTIDQSQLPEGIFSADKIELGNTYHVIDEPLGITVSVRLAKAVHNIDVPTDVQVELSRKSKTLQDVIRDHAERLRVLETADGIPDAVFSDDTPPEIVIGGTGTPGDTEELSRSNHSHGLDIPTLEDALDIPTIESDIDTLQTDLAAAIATIPSTPGSIPPAIQLVPSIGSGTAYAKSNHTHTGVQLITASSKAGLQNTGVDATAMGRVDSGSEKGRVYFRNADNDGWECQNALE